jgi:hypothetical protein
VSDPLTEHRLVESGRQGHLPSSASDAPTGQGQRSPIGRCKGLAIGSVIVPGVLTAAIRIGNRMDATDETLMNTLDQRACLGP